MSPTYFVFGSLAVKSRPIRSGAFAAAKSVIVVRCGAVPATQPHSGQADATHHPRDALVVDSLAVVAEFGGDPGDAVGTA